MMLNMNDKITLCGRIIFDPLNLTSKQRNQSSWKKVSFVEFEGDICELYSWFIQRRYNLNLLKSIRKAHVTVINDSIRDLRLNDTKTIEEVEKLWNSIKEKWDGKEIEVTLNLDVSSNSDYWWLRVPHEDNKLLTDIRNELGLKTPFFNYHLTIGYPHPKHEEHSKYIVEGLKNGFIFG